MAVKRVTKALLWAALQLGLVPALIFGQAAQAAEPVFRPPSDIWRQVWTQANPSGPCPPDRARPLGSRLYADLGGGRLLILLEIPDYLCENSNTTALLYYEGGGNWRLGPFMEGTPAHFGRGPDGALWLATQWRIEGTYPALYRSKDGTKWQTIPLPDRASAGAPFLFLDPLCFAERRVFIGLREEPGDDSHRTGYFSISTKEAASGRPGWTESDDRADCAPLPAPTGEWVRDEADDRADVIFRRGGTAAAIPKVLPAAGD